MGGVVACMKRCGAGRETLIRATVTVSEELVLKMPQDLPFHRTIRKMKDGPNAGYSSWAYIRDKMYARDPQHYVRAYLLIQKDLVQLFEYVEPSDDSAAAYSYRIHELLMRTCIEVEANFKAILAANAHQSVLRADGPSKLNMQVYRKVNVSHHLSSYEVVLPIWGGGKRAFKPFEGWSTNDPIPWYQAYNKSKHDRHEAFRSANLEALVTAVCGLLVLMTAQFKTEDFSAGSDALAVYGYDYHEFEPALGSLFRVKYPDDWSDDEIYDFDWSVLSKQEVRFAKFDFDSI